jgi:uracil-DNA glycosylase
MLWGGPAKKKGGKVDTSKHLILTSGHPSPLAANRGYWFGNKHFSKANEYLTKNGKEPIKW